MLYGFVISSFIVHSRRLDKKPHESYIRYDDKYDDYTHNNFF
jgi:hypothetical protein